MKQNKPVLVRKKAWLIALSLVIISSIVFIYHVFNIDAAAAAYNNSPHVVDINNCETDADRLCTRLSALGCVESCRWDSGIMHKNTFFESLLDIGPSQYWLNGYAVLSQSDMQRLQTEFKWTEASRDTGGNFKEIVTQLELDQHTVWMVTDTMHEIMPVYGEFYLDTEDRILIFDLVLD